MFQSVHKFQYIRHVFSLSYCMDCIVLKTANIPSMFALLSQRRMRWLGHVRRMSDGRIPKDILYGELEEVNRPRGRPKLRFTDVCKCDLKALSVEEVSWEQTALDRSAWKKSVRMGIESAEAMRVDKWEEKRERKKNLPSASGKIVDDGIA